MKNQTSDEPLKACPFCGGDAFIKQEESMFNDKTMWIAGCADVNCIMDQPSTALYAQKIFALNSWNTRRLPNDK